MNKYKFVFTGGGTGGHVYPNIAIYEALKGKYPEADFLYIGTKKGSEASIIPALAQPMEFISVPARGLPQNIKSIKTLFSLWIIFFGIIKSIFILRKFRADIIIGSGGYVAAPVVMAASLLKQKIFIHEQNAVPGRLNLFSARFATKIGVSFPSSTYFFPADKVIYSGYPLRKAILSAGKENIRAKFNIPENSRVLFICSGSKGARTINQAAAEIIPQLLNLPDLFIIISTGKAYGKEYKAYDDTVKILDQKGYPPEIAGRLLIREYFDNIAEIYAISDLVASRAGAGAIKEITTMELPSILIPKINLPADHQILNAREVEKNGGARVLYEEINNSEKKGQIFLPPDMLFNTIQEILKGKETLILMHKNLGHQEKQNSAAIIVETIETIIGRNDQKQDIDLRLFYLQSLEDEKNIELPFTATTIGNTFWTDISLENISTKVLFEINFLEQGQNKVIIRHRQGLIKLNEQKVVDWAELHEDDTITIDSHTFIFKSYLEKTREIDCQKKSCQNTAAASNLKISISSLGNLGRTIVNAAIFGAGKAMDIFSVAWSIAGFVRQSLGKNVSKNVFLPIFQHLFQRGPRKKVWESASTINNFTLLLSLLICVTGIVFAPMIINFLFPAFISKGLIDETVVMTRILFPGLLLVTIVAIMTTYLQAFNKSITVVISTIFFSLSSIVGMILLLPISGLYALGYGLLFGGLIQILFLLPFLLQTFRRPELEFSWQPIIKINNISTRKYFSRLPQLFTDAFLNQSINVVEKFLASSLIIGSLSYLYFAMEIFRLPFAVISTAIDNIIFKNFSEHTALFNNDKTKKLFINGIHINLFLLAPISILTIVLANPLVSLLLERIHFSAQAVTNTALALQFYAIGLIGWGLHAMTTHIFAARLESKTIKSLNFFMLTFNILLAIILVRTPLKFAGIALATSISYLVFALIRVVILRHRLNCNGISVKFPEIISSVVKTLSACLLMLIAIIEAKFVFNRIYFNSRIIENIILCVSLSFMGTAIYFLSSLLFKNKGILVFKKQNANAKVKIPISLLSPFKFLDIVSVNPDFYKNEYRYKINIYLANSAWEIKNIGIKLIGLFKEKCKSPYLVDMLSADQGNGFMRRNALQALQATNLWNPEIKKLLLHLLQDSYFEVRVAALEILGENISEVEYADLKKIIHCKLRHGKFEEKKACLHLIARKGNTADLEQLRPFYLDSNSLLREELLELLYFFYRRDLLNKVEIKNHIEQVLITSNHLAPEFKIKSIINRIYREIDQS